MALKHSFEANPNKGKTEQMQNKGNTGAADGAPPVVFKHRIRMKSRATVLQQGIRARPRACRGRVKTAKDQVFSREISGQRSRGLLRAPWR